MTNTHLTPIGPLTRAEHDNDCSVFEELFCLDILSALDLAHRGERDSRVEESFAAFESDPANLERYRRGCVLNSRNPDANVRWARASIELYRAVHGI